MQGEKAFSFYTGDVWSPMVVLAYVLINCAPGKAWAVADIVRKIECIKTVRVVTGRYDVIAEAEVEDVVALGDLIYGKIQNVGGVTKTETTVAV